MRRPSIVVLLAVVVCAPAGWTGAAVLRSGYLTLPTGSPGKPDTVRQPDLDGYSSRFFEVDPRGDGVVFTANAGGVTTKNSTYPRSELREMNGDEMASWSNRTGTHTLSVRQAVTELPEAKPELVTAQIHDAESDVMEVRLEDKRLIAQYADGKKEFVVDPGLHPGHAVRPAAGRDGRAHRRPLQRRARRQHPPERQRLVLQDRQLSAVQHREVRRGGCRR